MFKVLSDFPTDGQFPVLVYGTLREGQCNYDYALQGNVQGPATIVRIPGLSMTSFSASFPYVYQSDVEGEGEITAELIYIQPEKYDAVLARMDNIEGFSGPNELGNHYDRVLVEVDCGGESVKAWLYLFAAFPSGGVRSEQGDTRVRLMKMTNLPVQCGDWLAYDQMLADLWREMRVSEKEAHHNNLL